MMVCTDCYWYDQCCQYEPQTVKQFVQDRQCCDDFTSICEEDDDSELPADNQQEFWKYIAEYGDGNEEVSYD